MLELPGFYHPTTLLLLDDDKAFLNSLQLALAPYYRSIVLTSANTIESILRDHYFIDEQSNHLADEDESQRAGDKAALYPRVFQSNRFNQINILVLDYDMPQQNGLVIAQRLKLSRPIKIIMLTGEADQMTAIRAFNRGDIDRFITKGASDYFETLLTYVQELHDHYFLEQTQRLLSALNPTINPLREPEFVQVFRQICQDYHIVEYYLVDDSYSFLLVDATGVITWLLVRTEEDMQMYYELAQDGAPATVLQSLQDRRQIARFPTLHSCLDSVAGWHFYPAQSLPQQSIYYCLLTGEEGYPLETQQIRSYVEFLQSKQ